MTDTDFTAPEGTDPLTYAAEQRHQADLEIKRWTAERARCDAHLVSMQGEKRVAYGDVTVSVVMPARTTLDVEAFVATLELMALDADELLAVLAAAKGFERTALPEGLMDVYDVHLTTTNGKPYVRSTPTPPRERA